MGWGTGESECPTLEARDEVSEYTDAKAGKLCLVYCTGFPQQSTDDQDI